MHVPPLLVNVIGRKCHAIKKYTTKGHDESIHLLRVRVFYKKTENDHSMYLCPDIEGPPKQETQPSN